MILKTEVHSFIVPLEEDQSLSLSSRVKMFIRHLPFSWDGTKMFLWRTILIVSSLVTVPILYLSPNTIFKEAIKKLWNPKDPKLLIVPYITNYMLPLNDVVSDMVASATYIQMGDSWFGTVTFVTTFFPFFVTIIKEVWFTVKYFYQSFDIVNQHKKEFLCRRIILILRHLPFIQPITNLTRILKLAQMQQGKMKTEKTLMKLQEDSNMEPFLESSFQMMIQLYILINIQTTIPWTILWSIISSTLAVGMASGGTFLLERIGYPVGVVNLATKLFLAIIFMVVFAPRAMLMALMINVLADWSNEYGESWPAHLWRIVILLFIGMLLIILLLALYLGSSDTLKPKLLWDQSLGDAGSGIRGEHKLIDRHGYENHFSDLKRKSVFFSIFSPCITVSQKSRVFEITAFVSTIYYILAIIIGWILFNVYPVQGKTKQLGFMFPLIFGLLVLSIVAQVFLTYLSDHLNLHKVTFGLFYHPSLLVDVAIRRLVQREYEMEMKAKVQNGQHWRSELRDMYRGEYLNKETMKSDYLLFQKLLQKSVSINDPIIVLKLSEKRKITCKVADVVNNLRFAEDYIGSVIYQMEPVHLQDPVENKPIVLDLDVNQDCDCGCDDVDEDGNTDLLNALREHKSNKAVRIIWRDTSIAHRNKLGLSAFPMAFSYAFPMAFLNSLNEIKDLLWHVLKTEDGIESTFFDLCVAENIEAVMFCMEPRNTNFNQRQSFLKFIGSGYWHCPLFHCMNEDKQEMVNLLLPYYDELASEVLTEIGEDKNNPLIRATKDNNIGIVKHLLPIYREKKLISEFGEANYNALMMAVRHNRIDILNILIETFEEEKLVTTSNEDMKNCLMLACQYSTEYVVERLIPNYADANPGLLLEFYHGRNCLTCAVSKDNINMVSLLLPLYKEKNILGDFDKKQLNGLMTAIVHQSSQEMLNVLLSYFDEAGLVAACNEEGKTAMNCAIEKGNEESIELLKPYFEFDSEGSCHSMASN